MQYNRTIFTRQTRVVAAATLSVMIIFSSIAVVGSQSLASIPNANAAPACENIIIRSNDVSANGYEGANTPANVVDNNQSTRWSNYGIGSWVRLDLGEQKTMCGVDIAWYKGNTRMNTFVISVSDDGSSYTDVYSGQSSGKTTDPERYSFAETTARYVRITVTGINNGNNQWVSITEIDVNGYTPIDSSAPYVEITNLARDSTVITTSGIITVQGVASDDMSGVGIVEVRVGDGAYVTATPKAPGDWSAWTAMVVLGTTGTHRIVPRATDNAGNQAWNSMYINAITDATAPSVAILNPAPDSTVLIGSPLVVEGTAFDNAGGSGVRSVQLRLDDSSGSSSYVDAVPNALDDWSSWTASLDIAAMGMHMLYARVIDNAGNNAESSIAIIAGDTIRPSVQILEPAANSVIPLTNDGTILVTGTASDAESGVKIVEVRLDDGAYLAATPIATSDWSSWSVTLPITLGEHRIVPRATDNAGNQAWNSIYVTVENNDDSIPDALRTIRVSSIPQLMDAINSALPGDHVILEDGTYDTTSWLRDNSATTILVSGIKGMEEAPIVMRAETIGGAEIQGSAGFQFRNVNYLIIQGFKFTHGQDNSRYTGDVAIRCHDCSYVRFTRNYFSLTTSDGSIESDWLGITAKESSNNRIDHNAFENKSTRGNFVLILGKEGAMPQHNRIDHNHFYRHTYSSGNGGECLRLGNSALGTASAYTTVEYNLFEECNGDPEAITVKSSDNTFYGNTFRNSEGSLVLRHGNNNVVDSNFFINGKSGVRAYGHNHVIVNNYFEGNYGSGVRQPIVIGMGTVTSDLTTLNAEYSQPNNILVGFNTLVDNAYHMVIGYGSGTLPPLDIKIVHNIIQGDSGTLVTYRNGEDMAWEGNMLYGAASPGTMPKTGYVWINPELEKQSSDDIYRLKNTSPAIDMAGTGYSSLVLADIDGQKRLGEMDCGADEYNNIGDTNIQLINSILERSDVGPAS